MTVAVDHSRAISALDRGRYSIRTFAEEVLGVKLNPAQVRWFDLINPAEDGWQWRLKLVLHVAANQIGKTLGIAIIILWACNYKIGVPTDDPDAWFRTPYNWYHLAPSQNQAYLPLKDAILLAKGDHPAQVEKSLLPVQMVQETKLEVYYDGLAFWNGSFSHFRTTEEKAKALQGRRAAGISFDEVAFEDHAKSIVNEVLFMRLIASGGPLFMVSTPNGINDWYEFVSAVQDDSGPRRIAQEGDPWLGGSCHLGERVPVWETGEGQALVWSTVEDNIGFGIPAEEAARMESTLDEATKEQQLRGAFLEPAEAFFVPSKNVIRMFRSKLPDAAQPVAGHRYVIGWDPSAASDPTAVVVIDITTKPWTGAYFKHYDKPLGEDKLLMEIFKVHALYNGAGMSWRSGETRPSAITAYDETSMGGAMLKQQLARLTPKRGVNLAGPSTKVNLLTNLRAAINSGALWLPGSWSQLKREALNYKLPDTKIKQDSVMALLTAVGVAAKGYSGNTKSDFRPSGRVAERRR